ncbi:UDP-N-acetylglucosamine 2-epimerase (hydrolyzing) [Hoeflea sp. WL0058]|uniref:UDP-N-acetylglucosamine 2-epimerase (Hydrolyzing) n=1 Tax=Flavimaribacter sediminis TaxID=2865987 RepID=A0AAE2ZHK8_9HYPH|nr:UDP-N-acetylglucosamine 2-epimerase [Flavimaribacter sediminis]MBW8636209.1 UDP-N-acetylglucosamine 2-epimerase (hydrolyzing) [Flavimaribacter sediminis]
MKILAATGTRADWGLLVPVLKRLRDDSRFDLEIAVTGQHLKLGNSSLNAIAQDGFEIDHKIPMGLTNDDSEVALTQAMGACIAGSGAVLAQAKPDLCLVLGDRYEVLCFVSAALISQVPVAHLCGGDLTYGAFDDSIRHAITKMSALHFVTNADAARRIQQLGEDPSHVIISGSPGIDRILAQPIVARDQFVAEVGLSESGDFILVSFHPETLATDKAAQLSALMKALAVFPEVGLVLTGSNADPGGQAIDEAFSGLAEMRENAVFHTSLGSRLYFSAMAHSSLMLGNSSSGLFEAPSFRIPTVNIGDRQAGRPRARSVIDCAATVDAISEAIIYARTLDCRNVENPFGCGRAAEIIVETLAEFDTLAELNKKRFRDFRV